MSFFKKLIRRLRIMQLYSLVMLLAFAFMFVVFLLTLVT